MIEPKALYVDVKASGNKEKLSCPFCGHIYDSQKSKVSFKCLTCGKNIQERGK